MEFMVLLGVFYLLVPIALIAMFTNYEQINWLWLLFMVIGFFMGIAPFVAGAYLFVSMRRGYKPKPSASLGQDHVEYHNDGSYTVYPAATPQEAYEPGRVAFRVIGGLLAGISIAGGLLFVGVILLFTLLPSVACGGSSKCY